MKKITAKQRPIFLLFCLALFFFLDCSFSLFWHFFINQLPFNATGYQIIFWTAIFSATIIFFFAKFPFLRLEFFNKEESGKIKICRIAQYVFCCAILLDLCLIAKQLAMREIHPLLIYEISITLCLGGMVLFIEKIVIPAMKFSQKAIEFLEES